VRDRERKKLRKKLETPIDEEERLVPKVQIVEKPVVIEKGFSQADLDDAVARAVEQSVNRVEVLRKNRKEAKKKAEAKAKHDAAVFKEINTAMKNDVWQSCFI
jgi:peptidyl-tRNA hydrolase